MSDLISRCQGRWKSILPMVGIPAACLSGKHGPCPMCGGKDRFRFDDKNGSGSWICNECGAGYGVHLVMKCCAVGYREAAAAIDAVLGDVPAVPSGASDRGADALDRAHALWKASARISPSNAVGRYLAARGLTDVADVSWLRFGDRVAYLDDDGVFCGVFPAMLAVLKAPSGKEVGLHRTFLTRAGEKADVPSPRKILGSLPEGAAVRLAGHADVLGIAEGIETALSATALFGVPCWSAINSGGLAKWLPPSGVKQVVIFGDNDARFGGQSAAYQLAHRLACGGIAVRIEIPPVVGEDWNDVLRRSE